MTTFARVKKIQKKLQHATCVNVGNLAANIQTQLAYTYSYEIIFGGFYAEPRKSRVCVVFLVC